MYGIAGEIYRDRINSLGRGNNAEFLNLGKGDTDKTTFLMEIPEHAGEDFDSTLPIEDSKVMRLQRVASLHKLLYNAA